MPEPSTCSNETWHPKPSTCWDNGWSSQRIHSCRSLKLWFWLSSSCCCLFPEISVIKKSLDLRSETRFRFKEKSWIIVASVRILGEPIKNPTNTSRFLSSFTDQPRLTIPPWSINNVLELKRSALCIAKRFWHFGWYVDSFTKKVFTYAVSPCRKLQKMLRKDILQLKLGGTTQAATEGCSKNISNTDPKEVDHWAASKNGSRAFCCLDAEPLEFYQVNVMVATYLAQHVYKFDIDDQT